ncbi:MAG: hypothetical protein WBP61_11070 [Nocardioides sp.]
MNAESRNQIDYSGRGAMADAGGAFAGVVLIVSAVMGTMQGLAAIANPDFYVAGSDYLFRFTPTAWGWLHLGLAVITIVIAIGILTRKSWGQIAGVIIAGVSMLTHFASLPHYPLGSIILIALNGFVIWALTVQRHHYR